MATTAQQATRMQLPCFVQVVRLAQLELRAPLDTTAHNQETPLPLCVPWTTTVREEA